MHLDDTFSHWKPRLREYHCRGEGDRGLLLSVGLILHFGGTESCRLFLWTLMTFSLMVEGEWLRSGLCCKGDYQRFLRMHSKGTWAVLKLEDGAAGRILPKLAQKLLGHCFDLPSSVKVIAQRMLVQTWWDRPQTSNVLCVLLLFL